MTVNCQSCNRPRLLHRCAYCEQYICSDCATAHGCPAKRGPAPMPTPLPAADDDDDTPVDSPRRRPGGKKR